MDDGNLISDAGTNLVDGAGELAIRTQQEIPQWFIDDLRRLKDGSMDRRENNLMLACSIPVVIHHEWLKQGYDCTREPARKTIGRLKALHLDHFVATNKAV